MIAGAASGAVCQAVGVGDVDFWASAEIETPTGASFTDEDTSSAPPVSGRLETVVRTEKTHSSEKVFWRYNASVTIEEDLDRGEFLVEAESVSRSHTGVGVSSRVGFSIEFNVPGPTRLGLADDAFLSVARGSGDPDGPVPVAASASLGLRTPGGATIPFMRASGVTPTKQRNLPPGTYVMRGRLETFTTVHKPGERTSIAAHPFVRTRLPLRFTAGFGPCNGADIAAPFNRMNHNDVHEFIAQYFRGTSTVAELSPPAHVADAEDVARFVELFAQGCPAL